ncbi:unnamed protein product [Effrenium voratum]|nr:unnamed protein product [Effrenium voratum]
MPLFSALRGHLLSAFQEVGAQDPNAPPPPKFRKTFTLDAEPFEVTNWASNHRLELPYDDTEHPVVRWQLRCWGPACTNGALWYSPDYTRNVMGGLAHPKLVLHRAHPDPDDPDKPLPLLTLLDKAKLQDVNCSTDHHLTPFCNYCLKVEPVQMCGNGNCQPSVNHFSIRTTCPRPKFLSESDGRVFFGPQSDSDEQYWRLSDPLGRNPPPQQNFDFM